MERVITLELDDKTLQSYFVHAKRITHENRREFQMFLLQKKAFVKDFIYAEICHDDDEVDPSIQRKIIIDNLLQNLNMLSTRATNGYIGCHPRVIRVIQTNLFNWIVLSSTIHCYPLDTSIL